MSYEKGHDAGSRGAWIIINGKRVPLSDIQVDLANRTARLLGEHSSDVYLYVPPVEYHDPYPEEHE